METVMGGIDKQAAFYRAFVPADRSLIPVTIALATMVALWFFVYLVGSVGPQPVVQPVQAAAHLAPLGAGPEER
jgi:hypothetical protein